MYASMFLKLFCAFGPGGRLLIGAENAQRGVRETERRIERVVVSFPKLIAPRASPGVPPLPDAAAWYLTAWAW